MGIPTYHELMLPALRVIGKQAITRVHELATIVAQGLA